MNYTDPLSFNYKNDFSGSMNTGSDVQREPPRQNDPYYAGIVDKAKKKVKRYYVPQ